MSQVKARENVAKLQAYLERVDALPAEGGKVSVASVAAAAGIDRQVFYRNPDARAALEAAVAEKGLIGIEARAVKARSATEKALERRIQSLEARNAVLGEEIAGLRARLRQVEHIEKVMCSGRRVIP